MDTRQEEARKNIAVLCQALSVVKPYHYGRVDALIPSSTVTQTALTNKLETLILENAEVLTTQSKEANTVVNNESESFGLDSGVVVFVGGLPYELDHPVVVKPLPKDWKPGV